MIRITDRIFLDIRIDGNPIPEAFNLINTIALTEGNGALFPACTIQFNDLSGYLKDQLNLVDGNQLSVTVGKQEANVSTVTRQYRLFGSRAPSTPVGSIIKIVGIYDAPAFTMSNARESFQGSSSQVLQEIAQLCKLEFDGPSVKTDDAQTWLNICKTRSAFVQDIARRGYIDPHSAMACTLTSLGVLKYKNLAEVIEQTPKFSILHNVLPGGDKGSVYLVKQARDSSTSGMVNSWQNYGSTKIIHSLTGTNEVEDKLEVKTSGKYLAINQQVADTVHMSRVDYAPLDCSNVHAKYERALYQNVRLLSLFCERQSILVTECTDVQLFDTVYYRQADADLMKPAEQSDIYIVVGKSVFVKGGQSYAERLELIRMSVTNKGAAPLATQDPTSLRENVLPESYVNPTISTALSTATTIAKLAQMFSSMTSPVSMAFAGLGMLSNFSGSSSLQLNSLVGLMGSGLGNSANKSITALQMVNTPSGHLSSTLTNLAGNYSSIDQNLALILQQISTLPQVDQQRILSAGLLKASLFNPNGVILSLASAFPMLKTVAQVSSVYSSVQQNVNRNSEYLTNANPSAAQHIQTYNEHADNIATQYSSLCTSTNNIWNKCVSIANGQPVPNDLYNYTDHTEVLDNLANQSLTVPPGGRNKVMPVITTANNIADLLQRTDNRRNLLWMYPPSPINKTYRYTVAEMPGALTEMQSNTKMLGLVHSENTLGT